MLGRAVGSNLGKVLMTLLVIGVAGSTVSYGTFASFTAQTTNAGNTFSTGTMTMSNTAGTAVSGIDCPATYTGSCATLFNLSNLVPTTTVQTNTVTITYTGNVNTSSFGVYDANYIPKHGSSTTGCTATTPSDKIDLQIDQGATQIYNGTLDAFASTYSSGSMLSLKGGTNGSGTSGVWSNGNSSTFTIGVRLNTTADNTYQGCVSKVDLVWFAGQ